MSSSTSLNGSDDIAVECNDNVGSDTYLINDDRLLDDEEQAASDSLEDLDKPDPEPDIRRPCLNRAGVVVIGAAVVGVFVVIGVIVVVVLSALSLHGSSIHGVVDASVPATNVPPSTAVQPSKPVIVKLVLRNNCTMSIVGSIEDGVHSFKVCRRLYVAVLCFSDIKFNEFLCLLNSHAERNLIYSQLLAENLFFSD